MRSYVSRQPGGGAGVDEGVGLEGAFFLGFGSDDAARPLLLREPVSAPSSEALGIAATAVALRRVGMCTGSDRSGSSGGGSSGPRGERATRVSVVARGSVAAASERRHERDVGEDALNDGLLVDSHTSLC